MEPNVPAAKIIDAVTHTTKLVKPPTGPEADAIDLVRSLSYLDD